MSENKPTTLNVVTSSIWTVLEKNPTAAKIYFGGVAASILIHATLKGVSHFSRWKKDDKKKSRDLNVATDDRVEGAISSVLTGTGWGFIQGCIRGWIWPVHAVAVAFVLASKEIRDDPVPHQLLSEKKTEIK